jgi:hypothetical protein
VTGFFKDSLYEIRHGEVFLYNVKVMEEKDGVPNCAAVSGDTHDSKRMRNG